MGGGASVEAIELAKCELLVQRNKPSDGSDIPDYNSALFEIRKLRALCRMIRPDDIDGLTNSAVQNTQSKAIDRDIIPKVQDDERITSMSNEIITNIQSNIDKRIPSLNEAFKKIDTSETGFISKGEFLNVTYLP